MDMMGPTLESRVSGPLWAVTPHSHTPRSAHPVTDGVLVPGLAAAGFLQLYVMLHGHGPVRNNTVATRQAIYISGDPRLRLRSGCAVRCAAATTYVSRALVSTVGCSGPRSLPVPRAEPRLQRLYGTALSDSRVNELHIAARRSGWLLCSKKFRLTLGKRLRDNIVRGLH